MRIVSSACASAPPTGPSAMATSIVNCRAVLDCNRWYIFLVPPQNAKLSCANCGRARRSRKSCSAQTKLGICPNSWHLAGPTQDSRLRPSPAAQAHDGIDRPAHRRRAVGGILCGQALLTGADSAMVIALAAASGGFRPCTTVDLTIIYICPITRADALLEAVVMRLGKTLAFCTCEVRAAGDGKRAAFSTGTYAFPA